VGAKVVVVKLVRQNEYFPKPLNRSVIADGKALVVPDDYEIPSQYQPESIKELKPLRPYDNT
jgi:hypothetical protein